MIWIFFALMLLAAIVFVALPLYRAEQKVSASILAVIVVVAGGSAVLYSQLGTPERESAAAQVASVEDMVTALASRLQQNPDDLAGWKMLGRSYLQMRDFAGAIEAFQHAVAIESGANGETLVDLGEAVLLQDQAAITGRAGELFESAIALMPNNPKALFYAGMAALERGDRSLAADRWEALLATAPPQNIQDILRPRIAELRGEGPQAPAPATVPAAAAGPVVTVNVSLGDEARALARSDATVFVIARDPAQPAPPIVAVRRTVSELPDAVAINDSDAMIPGRLPSAFAQLEVIVRVSMTGQPTAQSGDWFGSEVIDTAGTSVIGIVIDQTVP